MTPEERGLITGLFERLKRADNGVRDREADDLINKLVVELPAAPYLLTQTVLVQEHALNNAQAHIAELEKALEAAKQERPRGAEATTGSSFLGGLLGRGPWGAREEAPSPSPGAQPARSPAPSQAPAPSAPQQAPAPQPHYGGSVPVTNPVSYPSGGGFLHQALSTAAGVAGGALLYDGIRSLFYRNPGPFAGALGGFGMGGFGTGGVGGPWSQPGGITETNVVNNYYGSDAGQADGLGSGNDAGALDNSGGGDPGQGDMGQGDGGQADAGQLDDQGGVQDADFQDTSSDLDTGSDFDSGGDMGGGDMGGGDFGGGDMGSA
jgi:hypothetical protein